MKVSGFTIVRNAIKFDYPIVEAITSILPVCDEVVVAVGKSEDETLALIKSIQSDKIKIIETVWNDTLREGGHVLADETNKAFAAISPDSDWAFYIQGDEVVHEKQLPVIQAAMQQYKDDKRVEGLLFNYIHFYGSYDYVGDARRWYRNEIRIIRNDKNISSYKDAQGFRKNGKKLKVKAIDATVYHYGWVKPPEAQQAKQQTFHKLWHNDEWMKQNIPQVDKFDYSAIDSLQHFTGTHPIVMQERIDKINWEFSFDPTQKKLSIKLKLLMFIEKKFGVKIGEYKNYKIIILVFAIVLQSCSHGRDSKKDNTSPLNPLSKGEGVLDEFPKGQIIDKIICKNDASQSYAMYLPGTYSSEKKHPVIYAFDPHGDGHLPVSLYKELAEKYGCIIIGSNNSKNETSWEESQIIANKLFADAENRLSINTQRIYVLGFSGGARIANALAISNGAIEGVICCGAAAPATNSNSPRNNYSFLGIVGNEDFNYIEMRKYDMVDLAGHNIKHVLITFDGKHEWPPKDIMDEAFWWLELNEMRKNSSTKNEPLIAKRFQPILKQLELYQQKKQVYEIYNSCRKTINFYDGLANLSPFYTAYKSMQTNPEIDKQLKQEEARWTAEEKLKQEYIQAMQTKNLVWWNNDIAALNQKIKSGKDKNKVLMYKRILSFLSVAAYMQTSGALKQNVLPAANFFSKIYVLVDPTNTEAYYLSASIYVKQGNTKEAINSLNKAVNNGFKDLTRLQSDSVFTPLLPLFPSL